MQPSIPVPTDNLHKFMATFGLVLIVFSVGAMIFAYNSAHRELISIAETYLALEDKTGKSVQEMKELLEKRIDILASNRVFYLFLLTLPFAVGWVMAWTGFERWRKLQPLHDELLELQVVKARIEAYGDSNHRQFIAAPQVKKERARSKE